MTEHPSVVHVLWDGSVGGIQRVVEDLAQDRLGAGRRIGVAFGQATGPAAQRLRATGAEVIDLRLRSGYDVMPQRVRTAARALAAFDVVHVHAFNPPLALAVLLARRPVVYTEHANFAAGRSVRPEDRVKRRLLRAFLDRRADAVTAISQFAGARMRELYGLSRRRIEVVPNGIDLSRFDAPGPADTGAGGPVRALAVGRLAGFKRVDRLLDVAARLEDGAAAITVVGDGPDGPALRARAAELGVEDRVTFAGTRQDVPALLRAADVLVHPARGEGFGIVILEACAAGVLPVVFRDGGGAIEALPPDGVVVADPQECATALSTLAASGALSWEARRDRARWVRERFPVARMAEDFERIYRQVAR